jgi:hypothetical protein
MVCNGKQPDAALDTFIKLLIPVTYKDVKTVKTPWIDEELKNCMVEKEEAKEIPNRSGCTTDWQTYCKLRNHVTKLIKNNKLHYETKIYDKE